MAAIDRSIIEQAVLEANDQSQDIDIVPGIASFDYYEDIFSPTITAKAVVFNTGDTIKGKDGKFQSIYNGLPLRGGERLSLKVAPNSEDNKGLDFSKSPSDYFSVESITDVITMEKKESFVLNLTSRETITNETTRVPCKFGTSSSIDVSVEKILKEYLKTEKKLDIDKTSNPYGFIGNLKKPYALLVWLASKAVPVESSGGTAGFVFFQTQDGFHFKSIDDLIKEEPKASYTYTEYNKSAIERNNDFNIIKYFTNKNQNLVEKLKLGAYASFVATYDPQTCEFSLPQKGTFTLDKYVGKTKNLGSEIKLPPVSEGSSETLGDIPSRMMTMVIDRGTVEKEVSTEINADPFKHQSQSIMRYNVLFTQEVNMTVPLNTNLRAGDIIECKLPRVSGAGNEFDDEQSGLYMIKELCHHFDKNQSITSMLLVRDTFGLYGKNNK